LPAEGLLGFSKLDGSAKESEGRLETGKSARELKPAADALETG